MADQGDGPLDVHVIESADAVTAWIAETLRRGIPKGRRRADIPRAPGHRVRGQHAQRRLVCRWL